MGKKITLLVLALLLVVFVAAGCKKKEEAAPAQQTAPAQTPQIPQATEATGPPTVLPAGETPEKYVNRYYENYKAKKWKEAYDMLPALQKTQQPFEQFQSMREGMPISDFKVHPGVQEGDFLRITVDYDLGQQNGGFWNNTWTFKKDGEKWTAESSKAGMGKFQGATN